MTLTTEWQTVATYRFAPNTGFICDFYLEAKYTSQNIENNQTNIDTRLRSVVVTGSGSGTGYNFQLDYASGINGNNMWYLSTETILSGNGNINHNNDGTKKITLHAHLYVGYTGLDIDFSGEVSLPTIDRYSVLTSANNFTDEENPVIKFTNPTSGYFLLKAKIGVMDNYDLITRNVNKTATSYTFVLTKSERDKLRELCSNANSLNVRFSICSINETNELSNSYLDETMRIVNANPTFNDFTYKDTNTAVTNVTGNNQILIKGLSTLQATINSTNKMVANKKSSAKNYVLSIENINKSVSYSANDLDINLGNIVNSGTKRLNVRAYDTRNNSTLVYKDIIVYDYDTPIINATVTRLNNFESETTLKVSGTYSILKIEGTDKNTIKKVEYRYREVNSSWSSWKILNNTILNGKFNCDSEVLSLDNTKAFEIEIRVLDNLQTTNQVLKLDIGQAIFLISSNKKTCYINGQEILTYDLIDEW